MVIIEGPDGAGKSTLAQLFVGRLDLPLGERSTFDRDKLYECTVVDSYQAIANEVIGRMIGDPPVVWDRMFYSDPIYARIIRDDESMFTDDQFSYLHRMVLAMGIPVFLCLPPLETVRANVNGDGHQLEGVREHIDDIYRAYSELHDVFPRHHPVYVYDYTIRGSSPRMVTELRNYIRGREALRV